MVKEHLEFAEKKLTIKALSYIKQEKLNFLNILMVKKYLKSVAKKIQLLRYSARQFNFLNILMVKQNITTIKKSKI